MAASSPYLHDGRADTIDAAIRWHGGEAAAIRDEEEQKLPTDMKRTVADPIRYREVQIKFLNRHLNAWFPHLNWSIQANAKSPFYRCMAQITASFLAYDTAGLLGQS